MRPKSRRRLVTIEELAALVDVDDLAKLDRLLRGLGRQRAMWSGSSWRLSDPGWAALLGPEFADVIAAGSMRAYRELIAEAGELETAVREPSGERSRPPKRARIYECGVAALQAAAGLYGEEIEVEL